MISQSSIKKICSDIWFDKSENLTNYPLKFAISDYVYNITDEYSNNTFQMEIFKTARQHMAIILNWMGVNYTFEEYSEINDGGGIHTDGIAFGIINEVLGGKYEARAVYDHERGLWKNELYTNVQSGLCIITKKISIPILQQLAKAFPLNVQIIFLVFIVLIIGIFVHILKRSYGTVTLEVIRAVLAVSMIRKPKYKLGRIIVTLFVLTFLILNIVLQSHLSAILTTVLVESTNVITASDLLSYGYKIYQRPYIQLYYSDTDPLRNSSFYFDYLSECLELMKTDDKVACVEHCSMCKYILYESNELHISQDLLFDRYDVILFRNDSPLFSKFIRIYLKLIENGIIVQLNERAKAAYKRPNVSHLYKISIFQLRYAFYFLICAYSISLALFFIELVKRVELPSCAFTFCQYFCFKLKLYDYLKSKL